MNAFIESVEKIMLRDLDKLEKEIASYPSRESLWLLEGDIKNTAGNLCLHLCGNLQHFIGAVIGHSGYVRDREKEFSLKGLSASELVGEIIRTKDSLRKAFARLDPSTLEQHFPIKVFDEPMTTLHFLIHLTAHLEYHLGQINYHRRLLAKGH